MALQNRYSKNIKGAIIFTGNTLGLNGTYLGPTAGASYIGVFTSVNLANQVLLWPPGTTKNWNQNSSSAILTLPAGSTVEYASLRWSGSADDTVYNVNSFLNNAINFTVPGGTINSVTPNAADSSTQSDGGFIQYFRSADVTNLVKAAGSGTYTVGAVPGILDQGLGGTIYYLGWTLAVVYSEPSLPVRNVNYWINDTLIGNTNQDIDISGFTTPSAGVIYGKLHLSTGEGDANIPGDQVLFGPIGGTLVNIGNTVSSPNANPLTAPNNPNNNFFGSQVNGDNGLLNVTGTFGAVNSDSFLQTSIAGARQGWDIANVDVGNTLSYGQTSARIRLTTTGDRYYNNAIGLELNIDAVDLNITKTANPSPAIAGQTVTYTVVATNPSIYEADNVVINDTLPAALTSQQYSLDGGTTWNTWTGSYTVGTLNATTSFTILLRGTLGVAATGSLSNTATVNTTTLEINPLDNTTTVVTPITQNTDISVTKVASPVSLVKGNTVTYTINVSNLGPSNASGVVLTDAISADLTSPQFSIDGGTTWNNWSSPYTIGTLANGISTTVLIRGTISQNAGATISNTATVSSTTLDPNIGNNTAAVVNNVTAQSDLSITKIANPVTLVAGQNVTYTINISNAGPSNAQNVILTDILPLTILNGQYSTDGGTTWNTWITPYNAGTINSGASKTILIRGLVATSATGNIANTASVASDSTDPTPSNNTVTLTSPVQSIADLSITKVDVPDPVIAGQTVTYTIVVTNLGPAIAQGVTLTDAVPVSITSPQFSVDGGVTWNTWSSPYTIGNVAIGTPVTILIRGTVNAAATGTLSNTATVASTTTDPVPGNNSATATTTINTSADISVTKTDSPSPVVAGQTITYTIVVNNAGPSNSQGVVLTDAVPPTIQNQQFSIDGGTTWNSWVSPYSIGTVAAAASVTVLIRGTVGAGVTGVISNTANVTATTADPNLINNTASTSTTINLVADLSITKTASPTPAVAGQTITYTMVIANAGPSNAPNTTLTDIVPVTVLNQQFSTDGGTTWNPWVTPYTVGTIVPGTPVTILIRGTVAASLTGNLSNTATVASTATDPNLTNNTATVDSIINGSADLSITKTTSPATLVAGQTVTYTITVSNLGPSNSQGVMLTDVIPATITNPQFSLDGGTTWNNWVSPESLGTINALGSVTVLIRGTVRSSATGTIANTASVTATTPDPISTNNSVNVSNTVNTLADVGVVKTSNPTTVVAGENITYNIAISNNGPSDAQNVVLTDVLPTAITGSQYSIDGGVTWNTWSNPYTVGTLASGSNITVLIRGVVNPATTVNLSNTATVTSSTTDPNPANQSSNVVTTVTSSADVSVTKTDNPDPVIAGQTVTYTITVTNAGPSNAQNVVVTDNLPSSISNGQFSLDGGATWNPWVSPYTIGTIANAGVITILIRGLVSPTVVGPISNTVSVSSTTPDPNLANNTATESTQGNTSADLQVTKTANPSPVIAGQNITYTIVVSNLGPSNAQNVTLADPISLEIQNPEFSTNAGVSWNPWVSPYTIGTLNSGTSRTILIRGIVSAGAATSIVNTASVNSTTPDPNPANSTVTVTTPVNGSADLSLTKSSNPNPIVAGRTVIYTIVVSNAGPSNAQAVLLTDNLPAGISNVEYSTDGGTSWSAWSSPYAMGTIAVNTSSTILIRGLASSATLGGVSNTASVSSPTPDPNPSNNSITNNTPVTTSADVSVIKNDSPDPVTAGQNVTYTIVASNAGPSDAQNVIITDNLPVQIIGGEFSTDGGATWNPWLNSYTIGTIVNGGSSTILIRGKVSATTVGNITNTVTVASTTPDPDLTNNTATQSTSGSTSADLKITKTANPSPAIAGQNVTYTILVSNTGPSDAQAVALTDAIPSAIQNPQFSINGGTTWSNWSNPYSIGTIASGASVTILIRGAVNANTVGNIVNTATVTSSTTDPNLIDSTTTISTPVNTSADVSVTKISNPTAVVAGENITYTINVANAGPSDAQGVSLADTLSAAITNGEFSIDGGTTWSNWTSPYNIGTLANGANRSILIRGLVRSSVTTGFLNTATVTSTTTDPNTSNNSATASTTVTLSGDISVTKVANPASAVAGQNITYTIVVANAGPSDAQNITLTDALPSAITNPQYSIDGGNTWVNWSSPYTVGNIVSGGSTSILIRGLVVSGAVGSINNIASVNATTPDPNSTNNSASVNSPIVTSADISVTKTDNPDPVIAGQNVTYTIVTSNAGPSDAQNVVVTDNLPSSITNGQFSLDGGTTWNPWISPYTIGTIANGGSNTILIRGLVSPTVTGNISNTVSVDSTTPDPNLANNTATENTQGNASADLSITKTANPSPAIAGQNVVYTVVVSNLGPSDAQNVIVTDPIPSAIQNPEFSINNGATWSNWSNPYTIGTIANGATRTILIRGVVNPGTTASIANTASVSSTTPDPNPANSTVTVTTPVNGSADLSITKTAAPNPIIAGRPVTYTLVIANAGPSNAQAVALTDNIPATINNPEVSINGGTTWSPWISPYAIGTVAAGSSTTILIRGNASAAATAGISNTASVTSTTPDPNSNNNTVVSNTPVNTSADISVTKSDNPDPVIAGQTVTYTIVVANAGPSDSQNVVMNDTLPAAISNGELSIDNGSNWLPWNNPYTIGTIATGTSRTFLIRGTVASSTIGNVVNTVTVSSTTTDPDLSNNTAVESTQGSTSADLLVVKTANLSPAIAGQNITYTIAVSNIGPSNAQNVILTDVIPATIVNPQISINGGTSWSTWNNPYTIGTMASGATVTVLIRGVVSSAAVGNIVNTATVSSTTSDPNLINATSTVTTPVSSLADISVTKVASPATAVAGQNVTYTVVVANAGPSDAQNVTLTDVIPPSMTSVQFSTNGGTTWNSWVSPYTIGTLTNGTNRTILIRGMVGQSVTSSISNTATVATTTTDPDITNNSATVVVPVSSRADLSVVKTASPTPATAGQNIVYTITVSNAGPSTSQNVVLTDVIPSAIVSPQFSLDDGATWALWSSPYTIGNVLVGVDVKILVRGQVAQGATGSLANTADVTSLTADPNSGNNSSTVVTNIRSLANLSLTKAATPNPVIAGELVTYTIVVANAGPSMAQNVTLSDVISPLIINQQFSIDNGATWNPWSNLYSIGNLSAGSNITVLIRGSINQLATAPINNTATVTSITTDPDTSDNSKTITTNVETVADLSVIKTADVLSITAGERIQYKVEVSNGGPSNAHDVMLNDTLSTVITNAEFSIDGGVTWNAWNNPYNIGDIPASTVIDIFIRGMVSSAAIGVISNTAEVTSPVPDFDSTNNTSLVTTAIDTLADIGIIKTATPNRGVAGQLLTYTLTINNEGPSDAQNVVLTDPISSTLINQQISLDNGTTWNSWSNPYVVGTIAAGISEVILIRGEINPSFKGNITNAADVSSETIDPNTTNNSANISTVVDSRADLSITKVAVPDPVIAGENINYTINVRNNGPSTAENVVLTDVLPTNIVNQQVSFNGGISWAAWTDSYSIGTLTAGSNIVINLRGKVTSEAVGTIINTARVTSTTADHNNGNNTAIANTRVMTVCDLAIIKSADKDPVIAGESIVYTLNITNNGPSDGQNVSVTDITSGTIVNEEFSIDGGTTWNSWSSPYFIGKVSANETINILLRGDVNPSQIDNITNTASISTTTTDSNVDNNTSTIDINVDTLANVSVIKSSSPDPLIAGDLVNYNIEVNNVGPSDAQDVVLSDVITTEILNPEVSLDNGLTWTEWVTPYQIGTIKANSNLLLIIRGNIVSSATGSIINTVEVSSSTIDSDPSGNINTITSVVEAIADLSVVKVAEPEEIVVSDILTYTITVHNEGPSDAENVMVNDLIPAILENQEFSLDGGNTWSPWIGSHGLGTIVAGTDESILIRGTMNGAARGTIENTVTISSTTNDPNMDNNTYSLSTVIRTLADISVIKTSTTDSVLAGADKIVYNLEISNAGPSEVAEIYLNDAIPSTLSSPEISQDGGNTWSEFINPYTIAGLNVGDSKTVLIRGEVSAAALGEIENTITIASEAVDRNPANNTSTVSTTVTTLANTIVTKNITPNPAINGEMVVFNINIINNGPSDAQNVVLEDIVSGKVLNTMISKDGGITWTAWRNSTSIGVIPAGQTVAILIKGVISLNASGTLTNTAKIISTTENSQPENMTSTAQAEIIKGNKVQDATIICPN